MCNDDNKQTEKSHKSSTSNKKEFIWFILLLLLFVLGVFFDACRRKQEINRKANELFDTNMKTLNDWKPLSQEEIDKLTNPPDK